MWAHVSTFGGYRVGRECLVIVCRALLLLILLFWLRSVKTSQKRAFIYSRSGGGDGDTHSGIRPKPLQHNRWPIPHACTLPRDRCLHVWSLVITASANYLETRRHRQRSYNGWVFDNHRTFDETSATLTPNRIKSQMTAHKNPQCSESSKKRTFVARWQVWKDVVSQLLECHVSFEVWFQRFYSAGSHPWCCGTFLKIKNNLWSLSLLIPFFFLFFL